jgi:hypothetical protein
MPDSPAAGCCCSVHGSAYCWDPETESGGVIGDYVLLSRCALFYYSTLDNE